MNTVRIENLGHKRLLVARDRIDAANIEPESLVKFAEIDPGVALTFTLTAGELIGIVSERDATTIQSADDLTPCVGERLRDVLADIHTED